MPMCVWSFLEHYDFSGKKIIPFCTNEGSGMGASERDLKKLCPGAQIAQGLPIIGNQVYEKEKQIEAWALKNK